MNVCLVMYVCLFFFFKQKTAYEMRISDWSSDVCSSDLLARRQMLLRTQSIHCSPRWSESVVAKSYKGQQPPVRAEPMLLSIEENQHEQALTCRGDYIARQLEPGLRRDCGGTDSRQSGR